MKIDLRAAGVFLGAFAAIFGLSRWKIFSVSQSEKMKRLYRSEELGTFLRKKGEITPFMRKNPALAADPRFLAMRDASRRWFLEDVELAKIYPIYDNTAPDVVMTYLDLPEEEAERYRVRNIPRLPHTQPSIGLFETPKFSEKADPHAFSKDWDNEFFLPDELAEKRRKQIAWEIQTGEWTDEAHPLAAWNGRGIRRPSEVSDWKY